MGFLTTADLQAAAILPFADVAVPELGADCVQRVRCLTARELSQYQVGDWEADPLTKKQVYQGETARGRLLALACIHEDGSHVALTAAEWNAFRADVADRLFDAAQRLSGLNVTVETLKKIFGEAQAGASRTSSPKS